LHLVVYLAGHAALIPLVNVRVFQLLQRQIPPILHLLLSKAVPYLYFLRPFLAPARLAVATASHFVVCGRRRQLGREIERSS
jgi:hypothetical protein